MTADEMEILIDLDRLPMGIGTVKESRKRMFETGDVEHIIAWIEKKLQGEQPISVLLTGHLPNWMMIPVCHYIENHARIEKFRYSTPGMAIYTVFDYTTPEVHA